MTDPTDPTALPKINLDFNTFTGAETMTAQREFECDWSDLSSYVLGKATGATRRDTAQKLIDSKGQVRFADEVLRWLIWTVWRRTDPAASIAPLQQLRWAQLLDLLEPAEGKAGSVKRSKTTT